MKLLSMLLLISISVSAPLNASQVVSPSAVEGTMVFKSTVFMPRSFVPSNIHDPSLMVPAIIHEQTKHLMGVFEQPQFAKLNQLPNNNKLGSLGLGALTDYKLVSVTNSTHGNGWEITYIGRHKILIRNDVLRKGSDLRIKIVMPHDPVEFYVKACTDKKYYEKQYLFYYWNPFDPKCKVLLNGPKNSVDILDAHIHPLARPQPGISPKYNELARQIAKRGELKIALLFGFDISSKNPNDEGRASYERFKNYFEKLNFIAVPPHSNRPSAPLVEYLKPARNGRYAVRVVMTVNASDQNSPVVFARKTREALQTADIIMYIGHSGLGGNLDLDMIARLSSPDLNNPEPIHFPNAYQIYYLDSCGSFYFYSEEYALARRGIHNVDIITNGTSSYFWTQNSEVIHFIDAFIRPRPQAPPSWSEILSSVETQERGNFSYLVNVGAIR